MAADSDAKSDFIRDMIRADVAAGKHGGQVVTRFPPEPNGWLHIGHAKAICVDFGVAQEFGGRCHLRMDDTNPTTEDVAYVEAIKNDIRWLGFDWGEHFYYASDYFERLYELGEKLIRLGRAYVCDLSEDDFSKNHRGTITEAGKDSPFRTRSVEENLDLFRRMRKGEFPDGARVLRARIDMSSPNMKMRDPPLVRIKHAHHYRTGDAWCIYPLYDYAHCLEDSFEGVTHSLCTMEFESARELYDWVIAATEVPHVPRQTEFARLNLTYTVMSKRKLLQLVTGKHVRGWDDPRMPTIAGMRRRGYTPASIRTFCAKIGVAKNLSTVDMALLESCVRDDLDAKSPRVMGVLDPIELVVTTVPEGTTTEIEAPYWPEGTTPEAGVLAGTRRMPFSRTLLIERGDFEETPPKGFRRLSPGKKVRLRYGYIVTCTGCEKDAAGNVVRVLATHDEATRGGAAPDGERVEGTIHWVSKAHAKDVEVRVYDRLCSVESPGEDGRDFLEDLNPKSLTVVTAKVEPALATAKAGDRFQLERHGFFVVDEDAKPGALVLNRTVALKDSWTKAVAKTDDKRAAEKVEKKAPPVAKAPVVVELSAEAKALVDAHGITENDAHVIASSTPLGAALAEVAKAHPDVKREVATLLANVPEKARETAKLGAANLAELVGMTRAGEISSNQAKEVFAAMIASGESPKAIVAARGMKQIASADALGPIVDEVLAANADAVGRYKGGNANVFGALVGLVMKASKGQANPKLATDLLKQRLG